MEEGRPTKYQTLFNKQVEKLCRIGMTITGVAYFINVSEEEIEEWYKTYPDFKQSILSGLEQSVKYFKIKEEKKKSRRRFRSSVFQKKRNREYIKRILDQDISKRIRNNFSSLLRHHLKSKNREHVFNIVGYTVDELMNHLEQQFKNGMTWDNYGKYWQIDHKKPVSWFSFESKDDIDFKDCWALTNLQPLTVTENCIKSNRYAST